MEKYMETDLRYLKSLANQYPTVAAAATEIINLQAILSLPKGTEHFITDIHGEYDQFQLPHSTAFFISFWQLIMPPLMECISQGL